MGKGKVREGREGKGREGQHLNSYTGTSAADVPLVRCGVFASLTDALYTASHTAGLLVAFGTRYFGLGVRLAVDVILYTARVGVITLTYHNLLDWLFTGQSS